MKVVAWDSSIETLIVTQEVMSGDETIDIPDTLFQDYTRHMNALANVANKIRQFQREQERSRAYADD
jgi:hypothetical protein